MKKKKKDGFLDVASVTNKRSSNILKKVLSLTETLMSGSQNDMKANSNSSSQNGKKKQNAKQKISSQIGMPQSKWFTPDFYWHSSFATKSKKLWNIFSFVNIE